MSVGRLSVAPCSPTDAEGPVVMPPRVHDTTEILSSEQCELLFPYAEYSSPALSLVKRLEEHSLVSHHLIVCLTNATY